MKLFVVFVILVHVSQHASGLEVYEGEESVLLPCHLYDLPEDPVVEWSRQDLNPTTIHRHQDRAKSYVQNQRFKTRTVMSADALESGDLSLSLIKPQPWDSGTYTCRILSDTHEVAQTDVQLLVKVPYSFPAEAIALLVLLIVVLAVVLGLAVYLWHNVITVSKVELHVGMSSVVLPFKTIIKLPVDAIVEWSRSEPQPMKVHVYQSSNDLPVQQDQMYKDRTTMRTDPLKHGDLSLTLSEPHYEDRGTYICTVYKDGKILTQKVVRLWVKDAVVEVKEWGKSVKLPFKTTCELHDNVKIKWKRIEPEPMVVHVYENGQDQPDEQNEYYSGRTELNSNPLQSKDLSVTLNKPGLSDRGTYMCTISDDGKVLTERRVVCCIKGSTSGRKELSSESQQEDPAAEVLVEVKEWEKSVTLPFKTKLQLREGSTIEWERIKPEPMVVHLYENGQDQPDKQNEYYRDRTKMNSKPLQSKDLSVTLDKPGLSDRGTYICTVSHGGQILTQRQVICWANDAIVEVKEWSTSVTLPFKTKRQLPEGSTIEWKRIEPKPMVVHVYENGRDQPEKQNVHYRDRTTMNIEPLQFKDLSVKLHEPGLKDRGTYMCTVSHDGQILTQRRVICRIKVSKGSTSGRNRFSVGLPQDDPAAGKPLLSISKSVV